MRLTWKPVATLGALAILGASLGAGVALALDGDPSPKAAGPLGQCSPGESPMVTSFLPDGSFESPLDAVEASLGNVNLRPVSPLSAETLSLIPLSVQDALSNGDQISASILTTSGEADVILTHLKDGSYELAGVFQCQMDEEEAT